MSETQELAQAIAKLADKKARKLSAKTRTQTKGKVTRIDNDGTVVVDAGFGNTPATNSAVAVKVGDEVSVTIENEKAVITGNFSRPATDDERAIKADLKAGEAKSLASIAHKAADDAQQSATAAKASADAAQEAADSAIEDAAIAKTQAEAAVADAATAKTAAQNASRDAASAAASAASSAESASDAETSASQAKSSASTASRAATAAQGSASTAAQAAQAAQQDAADASDAAQQARDDADQAHTEAQAATAAAGEARTAATKAQEDASKANTAANTALIQASIVEDVAGTLRWIQEHGTYVATTDTTVKDGTVYFQYNSTTGDYEPIVNPTGNPKSQGWYTLDITDAQSDFIMSHLAVTGRGLWVLPNGIGSQTTPGSGESQADSDARQGSGYKLLLSSDGTYIYDSTGNLVITYGANITPSVDRPFYIGDPESTSYIVFIPATGSTPASIRIGGSVSIGGGKTLSQILSEVEQASSDAATAIDSANLYITSTNGNLFKNGTESTVLQVAVFPNGGDRLDTIAQVKARFGSGAYIEWKWKHENGDWGTLPSNDPHLSQGGMWLTVTPEDVASKTSFSASLVTP